MLEKSYQIKCLMCKGPSLNVAIDKTLAALNVAWDNNGILGLIPAEVIKNGVRLAQDTSAGIFTVYWEQVVDITNMKSTKLFRLLSEQHCDNDTNQGQDNGNPTAK